MAQTRKPSSVKKKLTSTNRSKSGHSPKKVSEKKAPSTLKTSPKNQTASYGGTNLKVGGKAPPFSLPNQDGQMVGLADFKGRKVVLYFYPKDDTPGCTKESCAFRDGLDEIQEHGAVVVGVSPDSVASHKKFAKKFGLSFPLLSDESKAVVQAYGVWKEKSLYGRTYMGVERTTFIIDGEGKIDEIFSKVKVDNHLEEVLDELDVMP